MYRSFMENSKSYFNSFENGYNIAFFKNVCVSCIQRTFHLLHLIVRLICLAMSESRCTAHCLPTVIDKNLVFGLNIVVSVHDKPSNMPETVYPMRTETITVAADLECNLCCSF